MNDLLVLDHVYKSFGSRLVVNNVSFTVGEGEIFGFLGPNGAGKTTTIKMILGLLFPDQGTITINGFDVFKDFPKAMKCVSGIVESPDMYKYLSGYDNLKIQASACGVNEGRVHEVIELVGMQNRMKDKFKTYSLGMKQRLGVAQALLRNPKIMILDEPTNGLDPAGIKEFRDLIRNLAMTQHMSVLVSSHILQEMQMMCDRVGIISNGQLIRTGTMEELCAGQAESLSQYQYRLSPMDKAVAFLQSKMPDRIRSITQDMIVLSLSEQEAGQLNSELIQNGFVLMGCTLSNTQLEDSFLNITGGGNVVG